MQAYFNAMSVLKDGTNFSQQMNKIKFETLVTQHDPQVAHLATPYEPADRRFKLNFEKKFGPLEQDWTLKLSKHTSSEFINVSIDDGRQIMLDKESYAAGAQSSIICRAGQVMTIKFPVKPQICKWIGQIKSR